jgi:dTDP-4-amino-4,6-dideoxygalactose transaminase
MLPEIKLLEPKMPAAETLLPYLQRMDKSRWYVNDGPMVRELEARLAAEYPWAEAVAVSSGTAGLEIVYRAMKLRGVESIQIPALTFVATGLAAHRAGLSVELVDVDPETWTAPAVAGFGVPVQGSVVDAAGAWAEQGVPPWMTAVFSLHATKPLGAGEGGFIVTHNKEDADLYRRMRCFGMVEKVSVGEGTNAKLSEYHAAVGLASLESFDRAPWLELFDWYETHLPKEVVRQKRPRGVYPMLAVKLPIPAQPVLEAMRAEGIDCRRWYTPTLDEHPLFPGEWNLPVTKDLSEKLLGLPYHLYLTEADVIRVCHALRKVLL